MTENRTKISNIYHRLDRHEKKIDKVLEKIDELQNGGLSKAIQEQNNQLIQKIFNDRKEKLDLKKQEKWYRLRRFQIFFGLLGSGAVIKLLDILHEWIKISFWGG